MMLGGNFTMLLVAAFLIGGMTNPLYSLLIAYTNDYLEHEDMAAASGGLMFINGLGAIAGPLITGWLMGDAIRPARASSCSWRCCCSRWRCYAAYRSDPAATDSGRGNRPDHAGLSRCRRRWSMETGAGSRASRRISKTSRARDAAVNVARCLSRM